MKPEAETNPLVLNLVKGCLRLKEAEIAAPQLSLPKIRQQTARIGGRETTTKRAQKGNPLVTYFRFGQGLTLEGYPVEALTVECRRECCHACVIHFAPTKNLAHGASAALIFNDILTQSLTSENLDQVGEQFRFLWGKAAFVWDGHFAALSVTLTYHDAE
jgi:hypothetical protein